MEDNIDQNLDGILSPSTAKTFDVRPTAKPLGRQHNAGSPT
jgi:hypothetical protein